MSLIAKKRTFILEGITGSGKSTQARLVRKYLETSYNVKLIDRSSEVYPKSRNVRDYLIQSKKPIISESLLHQALNWLKVEPSLANQDIVVIDRFILSNLAYFIARCWIERISFDRRLTRSFILRPFGIDYLKNTTTIYLDCPVEVALSRTKKRNDRTNFDIGLQRSARKAYLEELKEYDEDSFIINSETSLEVITQQILNQIKERL